MINVALLRNVSQIRSLLYATQLCKLFAFVLGLRLKPSFFIFDIEMNFMEEINKETQAMLKQISIRKAEKKANAKKRIAELEKLIKFWEQDL